MRHDWILDVLTDLHAYACRNELPGLADNVEAALDTALREISGQEEEEAVAVLRLFRGGRAN